MDVKRNRDVYLNFGLICYGPLFSIEKLQQIIERECPKLRVVYQTCTARRLFLVKKSSLRESMNHVKTEREK